MAQVEYKNMTDGVAKNGNHFLECPIGALSVGDVVIKQHTTEPRRGGFRSQRVNAKTTVEKFTVTGFGGEFYSDVLGCDAVRAYCDKTVDFL